MVLPWLDQRPGAPPENIAGSQLVWEELDSWLTPPEKFHYVAHYGVPTSGLDAGSWHVGVSGLVADPLSLTLADLQARPRREVDFTLECSGNHGFPVLTGLIGNARWAGTPLAPVLEEARSPEGRHRDRVLRNRSRNADDPGQHRDRQRWADGHHPARGRRH